MAFLPKMELQGRILGPWENRKGHQNHNFFPWPLVTSIKKCSVAKYIFQKYKEHIYGKEISDQAYKDSDYDNVEDFFKYEILSRWENAEKGTVAAFDDPRDSAEGLGPLIRNLINRALRVSRHKFTGICFVLHRIRAGAWSQQSANSSEWFCLFPRSQKGKIIDYLNRDLGMRLSEARRAVKDFSATGRHLTVRVHAPQALIGPKLIRLL